MKSLFLAAAFAATLVFASGLPPAIAAGEGHDHGKEREGHGAELGKPGDPGKVTRTIHVEMGDDMRFKPESIKVKRGETIKFVVKNNGALVHEMVLGTKKDLKEHAEQMRKNPGMKHDDTDDTNEVAVEPGETGTLIWQFTKAGEFDFACLVPGHLEAGMFGKIIVGP